MALSESKPGLRWIDYLRCSEEREREIEDLGAEEYDWYVVRRREVRSWLSASLMLVVLLGGLGLLLWWQDFSFDRWKKDPSRKPGKGSIPGLAPLPDGPGAPGARPEGGGSIPGVPGLRLDDE